MNNRKQQQFDRSISDAANAIKIAEKQRERDWFLRMLPTWERRAGIIANMLETGQANGRDLSLELLTTLASDLDRLNKKIVHARQL